MMLWLLSLPAALWPSMGVATVPAVAVITYILIGTFLRFLRCLKPLLQRKP